MSLETHYLDLIDQLSAERKVKQPELAKLLGTNPRTYRRMIKKGLSYDQVSKILLFFGVQLYAVKVEKDHIKQYPLTNK